MNYTEAKELISALNEKSEYTDAEKKTINDIHNLIYKCDVAGCNCSSKYKDACIKMMIWFRHNSAFNTCHYIMQRGEAFMVGLTYYDNSNLTDEVAEQLIATNERAKAVINKVETSVSVESETATTAKETAKNDESNVIVRRKTRKK